MPAFPADKAGTTNIGLAAGYAAFFIAVFCLLFVIYQRTRNKD